MYLTSSGEIPARAKIHAFLSAHSRVQAGNRLTVIAAVCGDGFHEHIIPHRAKAVKRHWKLYLLDKDRVSCMYYWLEQECPR